MIRAAGQDDLAQVIALYRHLHPEETLDTVVSERVWRELLSSGFTSIIVAEADGLIVSSCTLAIVPNLSRGGRPYGVIENVVTHADYRKRGLGRQVLEYAQQLGWQADCYKVLLATGSKDEATLRFYEGAGFRRGKTYFEMRR